MPKYKITIREVHEAVVEVEFDEKPNFDNPDERQEIVDCAAHDADRGMNWLATEPLQILKIEEV